MAELTFGALIGFLMAYYVTTVKYTRNVSTSALELLDFCSNNFITLHDLKRYVDLS